MDPISTLNQVMLLLRQQLAEKNQPGERAVAGRTSRSAKQPIAASRENNLQEAIRKQIDALRAAGVEDERQLFRVAIKMLLLREFGAEVANDLSFQQMGNWVCECLVDEKQTREMLRGLIQG